MNQHINEEPISVSTEARMQLKGDKMRLKRKLENLKYKQENEGLKKNICLSIPMLYIDKLEELIGLKLYDSKSQIVRMAIKEFLVKEYKNLKYLRYFK